MFFWSCSGGLHVQDSGVWWLQTEYITVQSFSPVSTLQAPVMGFVWLPTDACYVRCLSHLIPKQGAERDKLHPKTTPFSASNIERLQGASWTIVLSSGPPSFLPHNAFSFFSRYLFDFSFLAPFSPPSFLFCIFPFRNCQGSSAGGWGNPVCLHKTLCTVGNSWRVFWCWADGAGQLRPDPELSFEWTEKVLC